MNTVLFLNNCSTIANACGPDTRSTAMAPVPGAVETEQMVSVWELMTGNYNALIFLYNSGKRCSIATGRPFSRKQWVLEAIHTVFPFTFMV